MPLGRGRELADTYSFQLHPHFSGQVPPGNRVEFAYTSSVPLDRLRFPSRGFLQSSSRVRWFEYSSRIANRSPNIAVQGILRSITGPTTLAITLLASQLVSCPFNWSPVNTTMSGFSSSSIFSIRLSVSMSPTHGFLSVSRHSP